MKKIMFLVGALVLLPLASFAQEASWTNSLKKDIEQAKKVAKEQIAEHTKKAEQAQFTANLSKEGKVFLEQINYFKTYFAEKIKDTSYTMQQKRNMITQQFVIGVVDEYEIYARKQNSPEEKDILLKKLAEPIDNIDLVAWMDKNYQSCDHHEIIKKEIADFLFVAKLSKEGRTFLEKINYFRTYFAQHIKDASATQEQKINMITQQFVIGVVDEYEIYAKNRKSPEEEESLLKKLAEPINGMDWVTWMDISYRSCEHWQTMKDASAAFLPKIRNK